MSIRRLSASDAEAVRQLWSQGLRDEPLAFLQTAEEMNAIPDEHFAKGIEHAFYFGAHREGALVGLAIARRGALSRIHHSASLGPVYIDPSARRQGLGAALVLAAIDHLAAAGVLQMELTVAEENTAALNLYRTLGFVTFGRRPRSVIIDGVPRTDLLMIRALDGAEFVADA